MDCGLFKNCTDDDGLCVEWVPNPILQRWLSGIGFAMPDLINQDHKGFVAMLVLARRIGDVLHIQTPEGVVKVVVMDIDQGSVVKLGVHACKEIRILREEYKDKSLTKLHRDEKNE